MIEVIHAKHNGASFSIHLYLEVIRVCLHSTYVFLTLYIFTSKKNATAYLTDKTLFFEM